MNKFRFTDIFLSCLIGTVFIAAFLQPQTASAQYCTPSYSNSGIYMGIDYVEIGDMSNSSGWPSSPGYTYFNDKVVTMKPSTTVEFFVEFGYSYEMELAIYIDWNQDGKFDPKYELAWGSEYLESYEGYSGKFDVPDNATLGETRMRVMVEYSYSLGWYPEDPCGKYTYGEAEDYVVKVIPNAPDATITALTTPANLFRVGMNNVNVTLRNNSSADMLTANIDWWINGAFQGTYSWQGRLKQNQTQNINLAVADLVYPANGPFNPFNFRFQVRNPNGFEEDSDPSNDIYVTNRTPILNDAGVIGFFGPPEGFGPGVTPVRVRVRNYAPKPLTSVTIQWSIDGVEQSPVNLTGLNIPKDETRDLVIGTYNFYAKTPLGPFTVECRTENPNGVKDEDQSNDEYTGGIGPSLAAGTYTIGTTNSHFSSPAEAASYINSSGIFGPGKVTFNIKPGTYNGQVILNSPLPNDNPIEFIGQSQYPSDIVLSYAPTAQNNFIVLLEGMSNISFGNLTFNNTGSNSGNGGRIIEARDVNGLNLTKINFNGIANSPRNNQNYAIINMLNCTNVMLSDNNLNNGSASVYNIVNKAISANINIFGNDFSNFSWIGILNEADNPMYVGKAEFVNNKFESNSGNAPTGGIRSINATTIRGNQFTGIMGTGSANESIIYVGHTSPSPLYVAEITENKLSGTNVNGIYINSANVMLDRNYVNVTQTANYGLSTIKAVNAMGVAANNQLIGNNMTAVDINNATAFDFIYNSVINESNTLATAKFYNAGRVLRNLIVNNGNAPFYQVGSIANSDQNVFYTNGNILINDNGANISDLENWQSKGNDKGSSFNLVEFESFNDLHIKYYATPLLLGSPLFADENSLASLLEHHDFDGSPRISYFVGSHELMLSIRIERQTEGFVDCVGATENFLTVSAAIDYNAPMTYQWEFDGRPIAGQTEPMLYFKDLRHTQAGIYKCLVGGPGATASVYSREVAVYVTRPTEVTVQPNDADVVLGGHAVLNFEAHVNGKPIENALANDEVKVRWYKYVDEANDIPLTDNARFFGTKSNYLTIRNFFTADQGEYYAVIEGLCGTIQTEKARLSEIIIDLVINEAPTDLASCEGQSAEFNVVASTSSPNTIEYVWSKSGVELNDDGRISGSRTANLVISDVNPSDAGLYTVKVTLSGTQLTEQRTAEMSVLKAPTILLQPQNAEIEAGRQLLLDVIAEGSSDEEVLLYEWYKDGLLVQSSDDLYYIVDVTTPDDGGDYYVVVKNNCGEVQSETVTVTITTGTTSVFEVMSNGYSLTTATPNPASVNSEIRFTVPTESYVKITLSDVSGSGKQILAEGTFSSGSHHINVSPVALNLSSGTYFYYLESNGVTLIQKLIVVK